ncbi:MAG: hypothetical protein JXB00_10035 [Bacteroidales bacterium]|nr:hypothetical protein [Bacteroidales bacterium]
MTNHNTKFKKTHLYIIFIVLLAILSAPQIFCQKFLTDTLYVDFHPEVFQQSGFICYDTVIDKRHEDPHFVMYKTKNKFLLFPVDQEIHLTRPLASTIYQNIANQDACMKTFILQINRFEIEKKKGRFSAPTFLLADIPVYEIRNDTQIFYGTLYYKHLYHPQARRETPEQSTENLLNSWYRTFRTDLIKINAIEGGVPPELAPNLIKDPFVPPLFLNIHTGVFAGVDWYGFQAEMYFNRPETESRAKQVSGIVRYQNHPEYESFAIGRNSEHYMYRVNNSLIFDIDLNILIGFLKWKDVKVHNPSVYQIINAELSSVQSILFNRRNRRGFTGRFGAIETAGYIYDKKIKLRAGLFLGLGYRF